MDTDQTDPHGKRKIEPNLQKDYYLRSFNKSYEQVENTTRIFEIFEKTIDDWAQSMTIVVNNNMWSNKKFLNYFVRTFQGGVLEFL
ncbi:hypothetical protein Goklo_007493 [Gossypium klotzschianum]|uniref:Uncharacterized protein n=1 Tax=Gossypium klotzschianum TaxID=34286 RepID=A0A7J8WBC0_9ROSI|nr:hypothetical protein [Gossypium klotzschianum]